jgi:hypothetical protein
LSEILSYEPHVNQLLIHDAINEGNQKYYSLRIGRQFGKSLLGENQNLYWGVNDKGSKAGWVSPIYKQCKKVYKEIKLATEGFGYWQYNDSDLVIEGFGSRLQFFSGENMDGIRGETFDYLTMDECDYLKAGIWEEVLQPTILVRGKKVLKMSTPRGRGLLFKMQQLSYEHPHQYQHFHFTSYDNPLIDHTEIDNIKRVIPDHIFKQEYLAEYVDNVAGVFKNIRECIGSKHTEGKLYGGLDIGRADDYTVLTIGDKHGNVKSVDRWRHDEWTNIIDAVATKIRESNASTYVEVNNQGDVFYEMLEKKVKNLAQPFVTSTKTKPIMIEDLAVSFEQQEICIPNDEWLVDELESFTYIYNPKTRKVQYSAPEGIHDDGVISLGLYNQARKHLSQKGKYYVLR